MNLIFLQSEKHRVCPGFSGFCWLRERLNKSEPPSSRRQNCDERELFQVGKKAGTQAARHARLEVLEILFSQLSLLNSLGMR